MTNVKKVLAFGEVMLRIAMDNYQMMEQTKDARLNFTGTGLNVLSGVTHFGHEGVLLTQLPDNRLGMAAKAEIRKLGISDQAIKSEGNHMGVYILEQGFGNRPSEVTYLERLSSSFGVSHWEEAELDQALRDVDLVHICGISLILTDATRGAALRLAKRAKEQGKKVCFDFNYRPSLNTTNSLEWVKAGYDEILPYADIVIGGYRDLTELLGLNQEFKTEDFTELSQQFVSKYDVTYFSGTKRVQQGETRYLSGFLFNSAGGVESKAYPLYVFDRVGTGDAFAAGILVGALEAWEPARIVEFATASGVLAHTTLGDSPVMTRKQVELFIADQQIEIVR